MEIGNNDVFSEQIEDKKKLTPVSYVEEKSKNGYRKYIPYFIGMVVLFVIIGGIWSYDNSSQSQTDIDTTTFNEDAVVDDPANVVDDNSGSTPEVENDEIVIADSVGTDDYYYNDKVEVVTVDEEAVDDALKQYDEYMNKQAEENKVFDVVEVMPCFPGGDVALMKFLSEHIKYPIVAEENGIQGRVITTFVVERDGSISEINVTKSVDPSLDEEAIRVLKTMPRWIPGKQSGSAVRVKYTVPVTFRLQ